MMELEDQLGSERDYCQHCGSHVSADFRRTFGDDEGIVHRCLACDSRPRLQQGSGLVTIPKKYLGRDGVIDDDELPDEQRLTVDRLGRKAYLVRLTDGGEIPELHECEAVRRVAAERMLDQDAYGQPLKAD